MPIYEYICDDCKKVTEAMQKITEAPLTTCPQCSGNLRKLVSNTSFVLKGGGWYKDGYSSTQPNKSSTGKPAVKAKTKTDTESETKPSKKKAETVAA